MSHEAVITHPKRLQRSFHVISKPIGSACNLDCTYCYYLHKENLLPNETPGGIDDKLLEEFISQYVAGLDVDSVYFSWHGGEPTLLGVDFFKKVINLQQKYAGSKHIVNDLQTNGLLLDDEWCEFFKEHGFLIGLSIDGPKNLHDLFRKSKGGAPTFDQVYRAARLLQKYDITFNTLTVVNAINVRQPAEVYHFLTEDLGVKRLQWLP